MPNNEESDLLAEQASAYRNVMMSMKKLAVLAEKGPVDIPSILVIRFGTSTGTDAYKLAKSYEAKSHEGNSNIFYEENGATPYLLHEEDGVALCEAMIDLNEYVGRGSYPGKHIYEALTHFHEAYKNVSPWTVALVADGIACHAAEDPEWLKFIEAPENADRGFHELFCDEPEAQKWLGECISVFLMSITGEMVSASVNYSYGDKTFPPEPIFQPSTVRQEGSVFDKDRDWLQGQRVIIQMVLFFAHLEAEEAKSFSDLGDLTQGRD